MISEFSELPQSADGDAQARSWVVRLKSGEATQQNLDALADWRLQENNEQSFRRAVRLWDDLGTALIGAPVPAGQLALAGNAANGSAVSRAQPQAGVSRRWVLGGMGGLAATVSAALFIGGTPVPAGARVFETSKGERQRFQLEPQVSVELNTSSRLLYWPDARSPRIVLDHGEAVVSASCEGDRSLLAQSGAIDVRAKVARFLIHSNGDAVRVACLAGALTIRSGGQDFPLTGGMEADFAGDVRLPQSVEVSESELAWQRDILQFTNRPLGEVVDELNRYRPGQVYVMGDALANVRITGIIHLDRADLAVDHIARSLEMTVTRLPGGIVILRAS